MLSNECFILGGGHVTRSILSEIITLWSIFDTFLNQLPCGGIIHHLHRRPQKKKKKDPRKTCQRWGFRINSHPAASGATYSTSCMCCTRTELACKTPWRQPNKCSLELLFTFPNLVVFLTSAIMWRTGSSLLAPLVRSSPLFPPTDKHLI